MLLSLDISTSCIGYSVFNEKNVLIELDYVKFDSKDSLFKKFEQFKEKIRIGVQKSIKEGRYHKNKVPLNEYENIKLLYLSGKMNQRKLAFKYGITPPSMSKLLKKLGVK